MYNYDRILHRVRLMDASLSEATCKESNSRNCPRSNVKAANSNLDESAVMIRAWKFGSSSRHIKDTLEFQTSKFKLANSN